MNGLLRLCRAVLGAFPKNARQGPASELPELVVRLVSDALADHGRWAAARTAGWELGGLVRSCLRAWAHSLTSILGVGRTRLISQIVPDLRMLLLLSIRERGSTAALVSIIAVVAGAVATFATLGYSIAADSTSVSTSDRLGWIWADRRWEADPTPLVSDLHLKHLRDDSESFEGLAALWMVSGPVSGGTAPVHADVARASANFFDLLEVEPHLGRLFLTGDDHPSAPWVAVLTYDFWKTHFGGDPDIVGKRVIVGVPEMEVVGVLPEDFHFPVPDALGPYERPSVWLPTRHRFEGGTLPQDVQAILGLRKPGVTWAAAASELDGLGNQLAARRYQDRGFGYLIQGLPSAASPGLRRAFGVVAAALAGMMAVALANIFVLAKARGTNRAEAWHVIRLVGGTRKRRAWLIAVEAALTGLAGAIGGILFAVLGLALVASIPSPPAFFPAESAATWVTIVATIACAGVMSVAYGTAGALSVLRDANRGRRRRGPISAGRALTLAHLTLALALIVGASVMDRAVRGALLGEAGFQPDGLVTFTLYPMPNAYPDGPSRERFLNQVQDRLRADPDIRAVSSASALPFSGGSTQVPASRRRPSIDVDPSQFWVAEWTGFDGALIGGAAQDEMGPRLVDLNVAQPGYFNVMGVPVVSGRGFQRGDSAAASPVAVVSESLASGMWRGEDPVGDSLWIIGAWRRIIGVVPSAPLHGLAEGQRPQAWIPHGQVLAGRLSLVVSTDLSAETVKGLAAEAVAQVDTRVPLGAATAVQAMVRSQTAEERFMSNIVTVFSSVALALAGCALYGLLSGLVMRRRKELAVRLALGGTEGQLWLMVAKEGISLALVGSVLGGLLYALSDRALDPLAFVGGPSPQVRLYLAAAGLCVVIGLIAGVGPGRRAARTNPATLLANL
ncbi:MAG: ABC transporter permease [Longimicrobiales bacterium]